MIRDNRLTRRHLGIGIAATAASILLPEKQASALRQGSPTLREAADAADFNFGTSISFGMDGLARRLVETQFNVLSNYALYFKSISPREDYYAFYEADAMAKIAEANGQLMDIYHAVWGRQSDLPSYIRTKVPSGELNALDVIQRHVGTIGEHFRGRIHNWSVVNEPFSDFGGYKSEQIVGTDQAGNPIQEWGFWNVHSPWSTPDDPDYIAVAFHTAREVDPQATLMLNEYAADTLNTKSDTMYWAVVRHLDRGVPIHKIGLQGAFELDQVLNTVGIAGTAESIAANVQRFRDLGLEVDITELQIHVDRLIHEWGMSVDEAYGIQAEFVQAIMAQCAAPGSRLLSGVTQFGVNDELHWHNDIGRPDSDPTLFTDDNQMKPAALAMLEAIQRLGAG